MTGRRRITAATLVIVVTAFAALLLMSMFVVHEYKKEVLNFVFYNDTAPEEHPYYNSGDVLDANFVSDILAAAPEEVRNDPGNNVEWFVTDLYGRIYDEKSNTGDPVLLAQLAVDARLRAPKTVPEKILPMEEQTTQAWETTVQRLIVNNGDFIATADKLKVVWSGAEKVTVTQITGGYTSMGYQIRDGIELETDLAELLGRETIPRPILKDSHGTTGWEITFHYANGESLSYRINCGYQPDSSSYGTPSTPTEVPKEVPEKTPEVPKSTPKPEINVEINDPTPTPAPKPEIGIEIVDPTPTPRPSTPTPSTPTPSTPTPEPKVPDAGPQGQNPDNPDYGGGVNTDNNTELRPEPSSPATYTPPPTPTPAADDDKYDTPADNGNGIVEQYQPDSDTGKAPTETIDIDTNADGNNDSSFTGEVDVGTPNQDTLDDVHENPPTVEPGANNGVGEETIDLAPPM